MSSFCQLIPTTKEPLAVVNLKDKEITILGKETLTKCTCSCSEYVQLIADFTAREVHVKQLCSHYTCKAGTSSLHKPGDTCTVGPSALLHFNSVSFNIFFGSLVTTTPPSIKESYTCHWYTLHSSLLVMEYGPQIPSRYIAAFDMDSTLIKTISGRLPFKTTPDDWTFWDPCVPHKLASSILAGYRIVIFTNQGGINYGNPPLEEFKIKIESIMASLGQCSVLLMAAIEENEYRKPRPQMWWYLVNEKNGGQIVDMKESFYVGDAAGRSAEGKKDRKKDYSCCDRKFAANINLNFYLPEEYFLGESSVARFSWYGFNPRDQPCDGEPLLDPFGAEIVRKTLELVIFVGRPASGKTHFYNTRMKSNGYFHVNRDRLGIWQRCVTQCERIIDSGKSVVIDNTNPDIESRARYVQISLRYKIPIRCMWFVTPLDHTLHNNRFREIIAFKNRDFDYKKVPYSAFRHYDDKFVEPLLSEGFSEIIKITINMTFTDVKLKELYMQFWD